MLPRQVKCKENNHYRDVQKKSWSKLLLQTSTKTLLCRIFFLFAISISLCSFASFMTNVIKLFGCLPWLRHNAYKIMKIVPIGGKSVVQKCWFFSLFPFSKRLGLLTWKKSEWYIFNDNYSDKMPNIVFC